MDSGVASPSQQQPYHSTDWSELLAGVYIYMVKLIANHNIKRSPQQNVKEGFKESKAS